MTSRVRAIGWRRTLGAAVLRRRAGEGLTQLQLARRAEVAQSTVQKVEAGEEVGDEILARVADVLGCWPRRA